MRSTASSGGSTTSMAAGRPGGAQERDGQAGGSSGPQQGQSATEPFAAALRGAWALVTCASNAAVEALLAGVPVFCTRPCAAYRMGKADVAEIETQRCPPTASAGRACWRQTSGRSRDARRNMLAGAARMI